MNGIPIQFGEIAVYLGYIPREALTECLEIQKLYRKPTLIGEVLVEKGYLTEEQVSHILKIQQNNTIKLENEYFIHLALKKQLLTSQQVKELRKRYSQQILSGHKTTIAVLASEYLTMPMVTELLQSSEYQHFLQLKKKAMTTLGGYEIIGSIIKLKRTRIYKAIQVDLDRLVAIKVLLKEYETEKHIKKFFEEAKATARFNHPNLVRIYDLGIEKNGYYYAMELIEGMNLSQKLEKEGRFQIGEAIRIIRQIAKALEHIHSYKIIHGKVNPRNIAIRDDGVAKLLDLSSSCSIEQERLSTGVLSKMPQYMAPEQMKPGTPLGVRTDIYSLGATFYRMITGHPPVIGKKIEEICKGVLKKDPKPPHEIDFTIPEDLSKIILRMMRKDPNKRYREIKNVLFALRKILI